MELIIVSVGIIAAIVAVVLMTVFSKRSEKIKRQEEISRINRVIEDCENEKRQRDELSRARLRQEAEERENKLLQFRESVFSVLANDESIAKEWSKWPSSLHDTDEQLDRQCKAIFRTKPVSISTSSKSGLFFEPLTNTIVESSLSSCSCNEFAESGKPCSHMYRLFHEITMSNHKISEIVRTDSTLIDRINTVPASLRPRLIQEIALMSAAGTNLAVDDAISAGVSVGLLVKSDATDYEPFLNKMTKDEIILALTKHGVKDFASSWTKVKLIAWVLENNQEFLSFHFKNIAHISVPSMFSEWAQGLRKSLFEQSAVVPFTWKEAISPVSHTGA